MQGNDSLGSPLLAVWSLALAAIPMVRWCLSSSYPPQPSLQTFGVMFRSGRLKTLHKTAARPIKQGRFTMQILIKTLTGRKQSFNFELEDKIEAVKQALQEKEGIQVDQIRLIYAGKQLADDKTLGFYNVVAGGTIHMVLQLRGGRTA